jgi:predicted DNA-binding ribbon-helix-helix protein
MDPIYSRRNITIAGLRTSLRLEIAYWACLEEICDRESMTMNQLCSKLDERRTSASRASLIRVFAVLYFREAANLTALSIGGRDGLVRPDLDKVLSEYSNII